ncbi:UNVERIFIED_CONTAM: Chlorophyllase-2, chloroplastic [Sesamum radiatum]|uniref:Chlorophyllase-2, chloroplastic n=1 Tax=Sesamum radiatum TaxID=300843 RepID=A0AAW2UAX7_SESRA
MNSSTTIPTSAASTNVFDIGNYTTTLIKVEGARVCDRNGCNPPSPRPLLICSPSETGFFPVLLFLHGYLQTLSTLSLSDTLLHMVSSLLPPRNNNLQMHSLGADATEEIKITAEISSWLSEGLAHFLPPHVEPNLSKLGLAGHSRGGKVAFALALTKSLKLSALIGIDPVDGMDIGKQTPPPVLTYTPHSFSLDGVGVLIIGSGLGEVRRNAFFPACAPKGVNHEDFYKECCRPAYYFVVKDYGHLDVLDDDTKGIRGKATYCLCKNGECREPMRRFVGGALVAFLKDYLGGNTRDLVDIREGHAMLPVELQRVEFQV